jgi:hypothetical protein
MNLLPEEKKDEEANEATGPSSRRRFREEIRSWLKIPGQWKKFEKWLVGSFIGVVLTGVLAGWMTDYFFEVDALPEFEVNGPDTVAAIGGFADASVSQINPALKNYRYSCTIPPQDGIEAEVVDAQNCAKIRIHGFRKYAKEFKGRPIKKGEVPVHDLKIQMSDKYGRSVGEAETTVYLSNQMFEWVNEFPKNVKPGEIYPGKIGLKDGPLGEDFVCEKSSIHEDFIFTPVSKNGCVFSVTLNPKNIDVSRKYIRGRIREGKDMDYTLSLQIRDAETRDVITHEQLIAHMDPQALAELQGDLAGKTVSSWQEYEGFDDLVASWRGKAMAGPIVNFIVSGPASQDVMAELSMGACNARLRLEKADEMFTTSNFYLRPVQLPANCGDIAFVKVMPTSTNMRMEIAREKGASLHLVLGKRI